MRVLIVLFLGLIFTIAITLRVLNPTRINRWIVRLGVKGKRHRYRDMVLEEWMHGNGIGV